MERSLKLVVVLCLASLCVAELHGKTQLTNYDQVFYFSSVFGTPFQEFQVLLDLTTWTIEIPSILCSECEGKATFNSSASSTFRKSNDTSQFGEKGFDSVGLAGVLAQNQSFWMTYSDPEPSYPFMEGFIGFGYFTLDHSSIIVAPWYYNAAQESNYPNIFSLYLTSNQGNESDSALLIGVSEHYSGAISYFPVSSKHEPYWIFNFTSITVGTTNIELSCSLVSECSGTVSSNSVNIMGPITPINEILSTLPRIDVHCGNLADLPNITINIQGANIVLPPSVYVYRFESEGMSYCSASFSYNYLTDVDWVFGTAFLRASYTVFNADNGSIGFGPLFV